LPDASDQQNAKVWIASNRLSRSPSRRCDSLGQKPRLFKQSFIKKLLRRKRTTGTIAPVGHRGGKPKRLSEKNRKWILKTVLATPCVLRGK
jgi:hypothetical protein